MLQILLPALLQLASIQLGSDRLLQEPYLTLLSGKRVGLITNHTGVDSRFQTTLQKLDDHADIRLVAVFAPEHGISGDRAAGEPVQDGVQTYSLYGQRRAPSSQQLQELDLLIFDIQDVGARFYTYISTLFESLKAAGKAGLPFIVLDRPNPIRGDRVEGPMLEEKLLSFVGIHHLPIRHGMTVGELARLFNQEAALGAKLEIVPLSGWSRDAWHDATGVAWILPSPNMPNLETAILYPGFCLIEGTNLSEGRGTTKPFKLIGAPWLKSHQLAEQLNQMRLGGVYFRPQTFTPTASKYRGEICRGIEVHVLDRDRFLPIQSALALLSKVVQLHPGEFSFIPDQFDRLAGDGRVRKLLEKGSPLEAIVNSWQPELAKFKKTRQPFLIY